jgi:hypothetical protein
MLTLFDEVKVIVALSDTTLLDLDPKLSVALLFVERRAEGDSGCNFYLAGHSVLENKCLTWFIGIGKSAVAGGGR